MDDRHSPARQPPPEYTLPQYGDMDDSTPTGTPHHGAAVRLLTSMEEPVTYDPRPYVLPQIPIPPPLSLPSLQPLQRVHLPTEKATPEMLNALGPRPERSMSQKNDTFASASALVPTGPRPKPTAQEKVASGKPLSHCSTIRLQRKKQLETPTPEQVAGSLPVIPKGPSSRKRARFQARCESESPKEERLTPKPSMGSHQGNVRRGRTRQAYEPSLDSRQSILDPPHMPPPDPSYSSYNSGIDNASPTRPWSPIRDSGEYGRPPPASNRYEPADINGSPRPGTPASTYGGSPRRPLPPAPLFSAGPRGSGQSFADDITVSIPLTEDPDDVFAPESDLGRGGHHHRSSYAESQVTLSDEATDVSYDEKTDRYGPAPEGKQERRGVRAPQMMRREVQLINGELVLECKIPTILYSFLPRRDEIEFTHMRYTAVTCDPDDFVDRGYKLRQSIGRTARETELFICITMYNEDEYGFTRTMHAVMKNISHFCSRNRSRTWGEFGWQKIVVCIVSDGREKIHPRTLDALAAMGVYQHGIAKNYVNQKAVQAHVYEYTTQVSLDSDLKFKGAEKGIVPCQMIFCLKEKNQKKLNSHRWFFNAFGKALNPNVCILLDVGTRPAGKALYHLWKAFDTDSNVAGACGEIKAMKGRWGRNLLNPLVASQNFEYKLSNILDKPLESVFGYITVLPGALSAYRYHALQNDETGHGPLSQYFKGETLHGQHADVFTANMYLAEDRILCWELVAKRGERWVLKYVKGCTGETDVPGMFMRVFWYLATSNRLQIPFRSLCRSGVVGSTVPSSLLSTRWSTSGRSGRRTTPSPGKYCCTSSLCISSFS